MSSGGGETFPSSDGKCTPVAGSSRAFRTFGRLAPLTGSVVDEVPVPGAELDPVLREEVVLLLPLPAGVGLPRTWPSAIAL
jgi:hypothetical protein